MDQTRHQSAEDSRQREVLAQLRGVSKRFDKTLALDDVTLEVRAGEILAVLGANGAGKTTALGLLSGRLSPDGGQVGLMGGDPRDAVQRRGIGVMLQEASLHDTLRVAEHVRLYSSYYPNPRPLAESLALADITEFATRRYGALSGGQQRRVQFALAICGRAPLIFIDEPSAGLDVEARKNLWRVIRRLRTEGTSIVLTTHYLEEADALAERIVVLARGRVVAEDTPAGIKAQVAGKRVRARTSLAVEQIAAWPEAEDVARNDTTTEVRSTAPEALLRRWLEHDSQLSELEVQPLSLEEAFLSLTAPAASDPDKELAA